MVAIVTLSSVVWLSLNGEFSPVDTCQGFGQAKANAVLAIALILTITNTVAFSRCDKFSQASTYANRALGGGIVNNIAGGLLGRLFK